MYAMLLQFPVILMSPHHFYDIFFVFIALIWLVVWKRERQIDTKNRLIGIISNKYLRSEIAHHNDMIALIEKNIKLSDELIECNKEKIELIQQLIALKK